MKIPSCVLCKSPFSLNHLPCCQRCNHSICLNCTINVPGQEFTCPVDGTTMELSSRVNRPFSLLLFCKPEELAQIEQTPVEPLVDLIERHLCKFVDLLQSHRHLMSMQMANKLSHLLQCSVHLQETKPEFIKRLLSLFRRILLEAIQVCHNTSRRMYEFRKLVISKGCNIDDPKLTDQVIGALIKLYNAVGEYPDSSFTREALIEFACHEIEIVGSGDRIRKKQVERVIQTLYRTSCFELIKMVNEPGKLKLRHNLRSPVELRRQHDLELIKMAHEAKLRLAPEDWAFLLSSHPDDLARNNMQSLLDQRESVSVTVEELERRFYENQVKCSVIVNLEIYLDDLKFIEQFLERNATIEPSKDINLEELAEALDRLSNMERLFVLRQRNGQNEGLFNRRYL